MPNYHGTHADKQDKWRLVREGDSRASGFYNAQADAYKAAKQHLQHGTGGKILVHSTGTVLFVKTFNIKLAFIKNTVERNKIWHYQ